MGQKEISLLEAIVASADLVAPLEYENPNRDAEIFFQFVRKYGEILHVKINEKPTGFIETSKAQLHNLRVCLTSSKHPTSTRLFYGILHSLSLTVGNLSYPICGTMHYLEIGLNDMTVHTPKYLGLIGLVQRPKPHEYMHAYHALVARHLHVAGLQLHIDAYEHVGIEPSYRVPRYKDLKQFERKFLKAVIRKEKRFL